LALVAVREPVELEGVLADVQIRLDRDLGAQLRAPQRARRRLDEVADAADVEDEPAVGPPADGSASQARDHEAALRSGGASTWQIVLRGSSGRSRAGVFHQPRSTALRRPPLSWTMP